MWFWIIINNNFLLTQILNASNRSIICKSLNDTTYKKKKIAKKVEVCLEAHYWTHSNFFVLNVKFFFKVIFFFSFIKRTSLLRRLQGRPFPMQLRSRQNPPHSIAVTFEPIQWFWCPSRFRIFENVNRHICLNIIKKCMFLVVVCFAAWHLKNSKSVSSFFDKFFLYTTTWPINNTV